MKNLLQKPDQSTIDLIVKTGDSDFNVAMAAQVEFAKAITEPLRQGVLTGDVIGGIFQPIELQPGAPAEFGLDLLAPGTESDYVAYTQPGIGRIPERHVEADYVMVHTYNISNAIDWYLRHAQNARWDWVMRALRVMQAGFVKKMNDDGFRLLIAAGLDRNAMIYDGDATAGQFTKRLVSLLKVYMQRNAGGNFASLNKGVLTDLYVSIEALEDIRNWGLDQIDEVTRREIYTTTEGSTVLTRVFGVNLHPMYELGESQEYQLFLTEQLGGTLQASDSELVVGLDLSANDSFIMPFRKNIEVFPDPMLHRQQREGYYGWGEFGFASLDNRRILLGSF